MSDSQIETHPPASGSPHASPLNIFIAPDGRLRASWRVFLSLPVFVGAAYASALIATILQPHSTNGFESLYRPLMALSLSGVFAVFWYTTDHRERFFAGVGLGLRRAWLREFFVGTMAGAGLIGICVAAIALLGDYTSSATLASSGRVGFLVCAQVWVLLCGAIAEEMMFRGYPFQRMIEAWGAVPAVCASSLLFGSVHLLNPHFSLMPMLNTMLIGALFAVVYLKTGSLWVPWGMHFGWNFALGVIFGLPVSGLYQFAVWNKAVASGPQWLTGGEYGIEASLNAAFVVLLAIVAAWIWWPIGREKDEWSAPANGIQSD